MASPLQAFIALSALSNPCLAPKCGHIIVPSADIFTKADDKLPAINIPYDTAAALLAHPLWIGLRMKSARSETLRATDCSIGSSFLRPALTTASIASSNLGPYTDLFSLLFHCILVLAKSLMGSSLAPAMFLRCINFLANESAGMNCKYIWYMSSSCSGVAPVCSTVSISLRSNCPCGTAALL